MKKQFTLLSLLLLSSLLMNAQRLKLLGFSSGYSNPIGIENCGDSRLFIVEQEGKVFICDSLGKRNPKPFLDITDRVLFSGEQGLLGLAFDPDYLTNQSFYVNYIDKNGNTQISKFKVRSDSPNVAAKLERFVLNIPQPFSNHNGGCIRFGPDGYLYIGMGDGGDAGDPNNNSQNPKSLLGKMLRIDIHAGNNPYKIPPTNPFVDSSNYKPEIWALGLRNPWRWSFDALNGKMFIGDVGQESWEEVDLQIAGAGGKNYGWRCYEGKHPYNTTGCKPQSDYQSPKYEYGHVDSTGGDCSITGGFVYRGTKYPSLYGDYIFTDYCSGLFRLLYTDGGQGRVKIVLDGDDYSYTSFGVDKNNEMYVCNTPKGKIMRVTDPSDQANFVSNTTAKNKLSFSPNPSNGNINLNYTSVSNTQATIRVTSLLGQQVYAASKTVTTGNNTWNIYLTIPKGNYYLSVINAAGDVITQNLRID